MNTRGAANSVYFMYYYISRLNISFKQNHMFSGTLGLNNVILYFWFFLIVLEDEQKNSRELTGIEVD